MVKTKAKINPLIPGILLTLCVAPVLAAKGAILAAAAAEVLGLACLIIFWNQDPE